MVKFLIWYNPNKNSYYSKCCYHSEYHIGDTNQFGHLLVQILVWDYNLGTYVTLDNCTNRSKKNKKRKLINRLDDLLYKLKR